MRCKEIRLQKAESQAESQAESHVNDVGFPGGVGFPRFQYAWLVVLKLREVAEVEHGFGCPTVTSSRGNHVMQHRVRGTGAMEKDSC